MPLGKLRVLCFDRTSGHPVSGVPFTLTITYKLQGAAERTITPAVLQSDVVGYLSFDLSALPSQIVEGMIGIQLHSPHGDPVPIDLTLLDDTGPTSLVPFGVATDLIRPFDPIELGRFPSIQNPDAIDFRISPGSFAVTGLTIVGEDKCEQILPSHAPVANYRFTQLVREISAMPDELNLAERAPCEKDSSPQPVCYRRGAFLEYEMSWQPVGHGLGEVLYSLPLAPCESVDIAIVDWARADETARGENLEFGEQLVHNQRRDRVVEETVNAMLRELQSGSSFMGSLGLAGGTSWLSGVLGLGGGTASTSGRRSVTADTVQQLADTVAQASASVRRLHSTVIISASQTELDRVETRTVTNHNHCHALTVLYYEVVRHYIVSTRLAKKRDVILVKYPLIDFATAPLAEIRHHRRALEGVLLDASLKSCFNVLDKQFCAEGAFARGARGTPPEDLEIESITLRFTTGNPPARSPLALLHAFLVTRSGVFISLVRPADERRLLTLDLGGRELTPSEIGGRPETAPDRTIEQHSLTVVGREDTFELHPMDRVRRANVVGLAFQLIDYRGSSYRGSDPRTAHWQMSDLSAVTGAGRDRWVIHEGTPEGGPITMDSDRPLSERYVVSIRPFGDPRTADDLLDESEHCCLDRLRDHLAANQLHYNRAIWLLEDRDERARRFDGYSFNLDEGPVGRLTDFIDNRPVGVSGDYVAFPLGVDNFVSKSLAMDPPLAERIISLPTRGAFAEAKLGHCNSCEEKDMTRFWDWQESPCPERPPQIAPVSLASRVHDRDVSPSGLPTSTIGIEEPSAAPEPGNFVKAVFDLLGRSEMFRDMSSREQVAEIVGKAIDGAVAMQLAQIKGPAKSSSDSGTLSAAGATGRAGAASTSSEGASGTGSASARQDRVSSIQQGASGPVMSTQSTPGELLADAQALRWAQENGVASTEDVSEIFKQRNTSASAKDGHWWETAVTSSEETKVVLAPFFHDYAAFREAVARSEPIRTEMIFRSNPEFAQQVLDRADDLRRVYEGYSALSTGGLPLEDGERVQLLAIIERDDRGYVIRVRFRPLDVVFANGSTVEAPHPPLRTRIENALIQAARLAPSIINPVPYPDLRAIAVCLVSICQRLGYPANKEVFYLQPVFTIAQFIPASERDRGTMLAAGVPPPMAKRFPLLEVGEFQREVSDEQMLNVLTVEAGNIFASYRQMSAHLAPSSSPSDQPNFFRLWTWMTSQTSNPNSPYSCIR